jgi:hypothetical protein
VAEQFAFDQFARDGGHVDRDKRAFAAFAVIVQRTGDQFLAGAGFAVDHDRQVGLHQPRQRAVDFLHGRRTANQRHAFIVLGFLARSNAPRLAERPADNRDKVFQVEGFGQIIVSAAF